MAYWVIRFILEVVAIPGFLTRILSSLGRCFQYGVQPMVLSVLLPSLYLSEYLAISEDEKWHKSGKWNCDLRNRDILEKSSNLKTNLGKTNWMVWAVYDFILLAAIDHLVHLHRAALFAHIACLDNNPAKEAFMANEF